MKDHVIKVCVRIPAERKHDLLAIAGQWRSENAGTSKRGPGWDSKAIHSVAKEHYGGLYEMYVSHGWPERGSDMMRHVQRRVKEDYGSVAAFVAHPKN